MKGNFKYIIKQFKYEPTYAELLFWISKDDQHALALWKGITVKQPRLTIVPVECSEWFELEVRPVAKEGLKKFFESVKLFKESKIVNKFCVIDGYQIDFLHPPKYFTKYFNIIIRFEDEGKRGYAVGLDFAFYLVSIDMDQEKLDKYLSEVYDTLEPEEPQEPEPSDDTHFSKEDTGWAKKQIEIRVESKRLLESGLIEIQGSEQIFILNLGYLLITVKNEKDGMRGYRIDAKTCVWLFEEVKKHQEVCMILDENTSTVRLNDKEFYAKFIGRIYRN